MKVRLPKHLKGFAYDRVLPFEMNSFDVDFLLPSLFFKVVTGGQDRARIANDPSLIKEYLAKLGQHKDLVGFDDAQSWRTLERLARTALIQTARKGASGTAEQIAALVPLSLLAFKPGFPTETSMLRKVDGLLYRMMSDQFRGDHLLREFFEKIFGEGIVLQRAPEPGGHYDGTTPLDTLTRLSLALLDGFQSVGVRRLKEKPAHEICPEVAEWMARDLRRYMEAYRDLMPVQSFSYHLVSLIALELFIYTMKLVYAINDLVQEANAANGEISLPAAMQSPSQTSPPTIYVDFTQDADGLSRQMAGHCVQRDLEALQQFIESHITLRQLDRYLTDSKNNRTIGRMVSSALAEDVHGPAYVRQLLELTQNEQIQRVLDAKADEDIRAIYQLNSDDDEQDNDTTESTALDELTASARSSLDRVLILLVEGQRATISTNIAQWYWSVGGLTKPFGLLAGTTKSRQSWRYAPSNDLLATLVQLAAINIPKWNPHHPAPQSIGLGEFLDFLEERFGILVDRAPQGFTGAEYTAAARDNLQAMLSRLRQMGVFSNLSDDFTIQKLTPPYTEQFEEIS